VRAATVGTYAGFRVWSRGAGKVRLTPAVERLFCKCLTGQRLCVR
jgi:hypothetical protein